MRKKALSLALALILCLCLAAPAFAASSDFVIENGVLTEYNGFGGDVVIPSSVTSIGYSAFWYCQSLTSVTIPNSVTSIGDYAFQDCRRLTGVTVPKSVTRIGEEAFAGCDSLAAIQVASNNPRYCSVDGVLFTKDMKTLIACPGGKQGAYSIPNSVTGIEKSAFQYCCGLTSITIPDSVASIGTGTFYSCTSLTSVTIPGSVTRIMDGAFKNCYSLTSAAIPSSVTRIENSAFNLCDNLADVYYSGSEAQWKAVKIGAENDALLKATIHYNSVLPETPDPTASQSESAMPTNDQLTVNGVLQNPTVYKIGGSNYFKIRDLAAMLSGTEKQFDVGYDGELASVTLTTGKGYAKLDTDLAGAAAGGNQTANPSNDTIYINGQKTDVTVYKINGSNYFKLRDLGRALDFYVGWTARDGVFIDTSKPYSE